MNIPQTQVGEWWNTNDNRFPPSEEIDRALDQHYYDLVANMRQRKEIAAPLWVGKLGQTWILIAGRKRLLAARELLQEGMKEFAFIPVRVFICKSKDDVAALRLAENFIRSANPVGDYLAIRSLIQKLGDYKKVAVKVGIRAKDIADMDKAFAPVPDVILQGVLDNKISLTTAIKVGRLENPETKKAMVTLFLQKGELLGKDVDATRKAIIEEAKGNLTFMNEVTQPRNRNSWSREELVTAMKMAEAEGATRTAKYLLGLVS
jgi:ParB-like chromosome segregation protein Spo0J